MTPPPKPKVSRRPSLPLIWVVPLAALIIAGWMIARQFRNHGPEITIEFASGEGIEAGKTQLEHKGVAVGTVTDVELSSDLKRVLVKLRLTKSARSLARKGSEFWVVHPEVTLSGVRGLDTILTGVRLNVRPGQGPPAHTFRGLNRPPPADDATAGRAFILRAGALRGLMPGAPVYYRGVKVGTVETTTLADNATAALIRIRIYTPYVNLVRTNSVFWNAGGFAFRVTLLGAQLKSTSLESLLQGGVSFATPDKDMGPPAGDGAEFVLNDEHDKDWLKWQPHIAIHPVESAPPEGQREPVEAGAGLLRSQKQH